MMRSASLGANVRFRYEIITLNQLIGLMKKLHLNMRVIVSHVLIHAGLYSLQFF